MLNLEGAVYSIFRNYVIIGYVIKQGWAIDNSTSLMT